MSANDSELPLAKVGQRQTPLSKPPPEYPEGVFALLVRLIDKCHQVLGKAFALPLVRRVIGAFIDVQYGIGNLVGHIVRCVLSVEIAFPTVDKH